MQYINYTPHSIVFNDGRVFQTSGMIARIQESYDSIIIEDCCSILVGEVEGLPPPSHGVRYIVSAMVLAACDRKDLVAPATGHPLTVRNEKGHIVSVPCFVSQKERSKSCSNS